jgi:hypothetical protein
MKLRIEKKYDYRHQMMRSVIDLLFPRYRLRDIEYGLFNIASQIGGIVLSHTFSDASIEILLPQLEAMGIRNKRDILILRNHLGKLRLLDDDSSYSLHPKLIAILEKVSNGVKNNEDIEITYVIRSKEEK